MPRLPSARGRYIKVGGRKRERETAGIVLGTHIENYILAKQICIRSVLAQSWPNDFPGHKTKAGNRQRRERESEREKERNRKREREREALPKLLTSIRMWST